MQIFSEPIIPPPPILRPKSEGSQRSLPSFSDLCEIRKEEGILTTHSQLFEGKELQYLDRFRSVCLCDLLVKVTVFHNLYRTTGSCCTGLILIVGCLGPFCGHTCYLTFHLCLIPEHRYATGMTAHLILAQRIAKQYSLTFIFFVAFTKWLRIFIISFL